MALDQYLSQPLLFSTIVLFLTWLIFSFWNRNRKLPPGPWGFPILGYFPFLTTTHEDFTRLSKIYGNVFSFRSVGGRLIVVLNGHKTIKDVLVNRADEFIGRPRGNNLVSWLSHGLGITQEEGQPWSEQRRFFLQTAKNFGFGKTELEEKIHDEIKILLAELKKHGSKPVDFHFNIAYTFNCIISRVLFNRKFDRDRTFRKNLTNMNQLVEMFTGTTLMLIGWPFSFITSFGKYKKFSDGRNEIEKFSNKVVEDLTEKFDPSNLSCYVEAYLQQRKEQLQKGIKDGGSFTRERLQANALNLFFEGTESVSSTTTSLLYELSKHPDVQKRIQDELDNVVGRERLPSWVDRPKLPYLDATIQELYRLGAIFLVTTTYSNFKETSIEGFLIPKRSVIVSNLYSIHFDPKLYPNPKKFDPKRFLTDEGKRIKQEAGPYLFGLGKRSCIGESLAQMEIFLFISSLMQSFTLQPADDAEHLTVIPRD